MSLVRWTGPVLEHVTPWHAIELVEKKKPKIAGDDYAELYRKYMNQFIRGEAEDRAVYLKAGATVYRGAETEDFEREFTGAPSYRGAFFGDLSVAARYYLVPGSEQPGATPRSVAELILTRDLRLFPMTYSNLLAFKKAAEEKLAPEDETYRRRALKTIDLVISYGVKGGLKTNVDFGQLVSGTLTVLGKYDGFAFYREFFEPEDTEEGQRSRDIFGMDPNRSNEQCYVGTPENTFNKSPFVFTKKFKLYEFPAFPNFWGERYPLHPILDKDARNYLSRRTFTEIDATKDVSDGEYYRQFRFPSPDYWSRFYNSSRDVQIYVILPAGSVVYQAPGFPTIFSTREVAEKRAEKNGHPPSKVIKRVTVKTIILGNLFSDLLDLMSDDWFLRRFEPMEETIIQQSIDEVQRSGKLNDENSAILARAWSVAQSKAAEIDNTLAPVAGIARQGAKKLGVFNKYGVRINFQLQDQDWEVHIVNPEETFETDLPSTYNQLIYADQEVKEDPRITRSRKQTVRFSPY